MLAKISVKKPILVVVMIIILIGLGVVSFTNTETDLLPGMDLPYIVVVSIYAGAAPELVESEVTAPVEGALASLSGIKSMTSESNENYSLVILELYDDADTTAVHSEIERALKMAPLPNDDMFMEPIVLKIDPTMLPIMEISMGRSGNSVKESIEYFNNVITRINAIDGVASVGTSGLITNLAIISLDTEKTTQAVLNKLLGQFNIDFKLPDGVKERARLELQDILRDAENNPSLVTNGVLDPAKVLDAFIRELEADTSGGGGDATMEAVLQVVINELKRQDSPARANAIEVIKTIIDNRYIVEDGEINQAVFYDLMDGIFKQGVLSIVNGTVSEMVGMLTSDLLEQLIMAQDLSVPAGNISEGAKNFVVKIGDTIVDRSEFMNLPVFTIDLGSIIDEYLGELETFLRAVALVSGGTFSFTDAQLMEGAEALSWYSEVPDNFAEWAVDTLTSGNVANPYYMPDAARDEWVAVIEADPSYKALVGVWESESLPFAWRSQLLNLIKNNALYPANDTSIAPALLWDATYSAYYLDKAQALFDDMRSSVPVPADFAASADGTVTAEDLYFAYLADYVVGLTENATFPNGAAGMNDARRAEWTQQIAEDASFRAYVLANGVNSGSDVYDWHRVAINAVTVGQIYPAHFSSASKTTFAGVFAAAAAIYAPVSDDSDYFAAYLSGILAETDQEQDFYLSPQFIAEYTGYLADNAGFKAFVAAFGVNDNWQHAVLDYYNTHSDLMPPVGTEIRAAMVWNQTRKNQYDTRIDAQIATYAPLENVFSGIENEAVLRSLMSYFDGRSPEEVYDTFQSILTLIGTYGGEGALKITTQNGEPLYTLDLNILRATVTALSENVKLTVTMGDLGNIIFLDDSSKQITTLMTRNADGTMTPKNSVQISVEKEPGKSTATISEGVNALLENLHKEDPDFNFTILSDDGRSIQFMMGSVTSSLLYGALLAMLILFVFLRSIKATLAISFSIVISVVFTFTLMYFSGITMNIVSMGGLALGVGMLVDNSIVVLENIYRLRAQGKTVVEAAIAGTKQVAGAIFASTLTTMVVFLPIIFIDGLVKQIFKDLALTICFSLLASLLTAMTLIPMSVTTFLKKPPKPPKKAPKNIVKKAYVKALNFSLNNKWLVFVVVLTLLGGSIWAAFSLGTELFPNNYMGSISVEFTFDLDRINEKNIGLTPLSDNYYTNEDAEKQAIADMQEVFSQFKDIDSAGISRSGGLQVAGMSLGGGTLQASVTLIDENKRSMKPTELTVELQAALNEKGAGLYETTVGMVSMANMFTSEAGNSYSVFLYGDDYEEMIEEAKKLTEKFANVKGVYYVDDGTTSDSKEYKLSIDKDAANRLVGLTVGQIYYQISDALTAPASLHTLRIKDVDTGKRENVDTYLYTSDYQNKAWYKSVDAAQNPVNIYFKNNDTDETGGNTEYYVKNTSSSAIFVRTVKDGEEFIVAVQAAGDIPVRRTGDGSFGYEYVSAVEKPDGTYDVSYLSRSFTVTDPMQYYSSKHEAIDLLTLPIVSEDMMSTGAETVIVPLWKLLSDDCFQKDDQGNIIYREANVNGEKIPYALATQDGYASIRRVSRVKCVTLTVSYDNTVKAEDVTAAVDGIVAEYNKTKPASVYISKDGGEIQVMDSVFSTLLIVLAFAVALIYLVMAAQFQGFKAPLIIMSTIPLAFTGSFLLLAAARMPISIMAMMGLIILMGVVVNNGIVFVDYANRLIESGVDKRTALFRTGVDRMRPIFMTAATTILAMVIMAADGSDYGQMLQPLAITSIGGLAYATVVTLFIIPIIYDLLNRKGINSEKKRVLREQLLAEVDPDNIFDSLDPAMATFIGETVTGKQYRIINIKRGKGKEDTDFALEIAETGEIFELADTEIAADVADAETDIPVDAEVSANAEVVEDTAAVVKADDAFAATETNIPVNISAAVTTETDKPTAASATADADKPADVAVPAQPLCVGMQLPIPDGVPEGWRFFNVKAGRGKYICERCGTVNATSKPVCSHCGTLREKK
ncbi:MAG: efflux RND transporter permease subunit [Clostridiaceae bacterium]|jgi:multidrug efflux pump subunit AcrB|nr:efflux RND transporter permease subunit [Clostridiaceae bacterium]